MRTSAPIPELAQTAGTVRLWRVPVFTPGAWPGHVFLETPSGCFGWWPRDTRDVHWFLDYFRRKTVAGEVSAAEREWIRLGQARVVRSWEMSAEVLERLRRSIEGSAGGTYQLGNREGGRNCVGWALERLHEAGLTTPKAPEPATPGLAPWALGRWARS